MVKVSSCRFPQQACSLRIVNFLYFEVTIYNLFILDWHNMEATVDSLEALLSFGEVV